MTRTAEIAGALIVVAGVVGWLFHWYVLDVKYWFRREPRAGEAVYIIPDEELIVGDQTFGTGIDWDALDPDTQADVLIREWHDDQWERGPNTDIMAAVTDDPELLLWDIRRQKEKIRDAIDAWRLEIAEIMGSAA